MLLCSTVRQEDDAGIEGRARARTLKAGQEEESDLRLQELIGDGLPGAGIHNVQKMRCKAGFVRALAADVGQQSRYHPVEAPRCSPPLPHVLRSMDADHTRDALQGMSCEVMLLMGTNNEEQRSNNSNKSSCSRWMHWEWSRETLFTLVRIDAEAGCRGRDAVASLVSGRLSTEMRGQYKRGCRR